MKDEFEESFGQYSYEEELAFVRDMLLSQASELQECYRYIYDCNREYQSDLSTNICEFVRLSRVGLEQAYQMLDDETFDKSDAKSYHWAPKFIDED